MLRAPTLLLLLALVGQAAVVTKLRGSSASFCRPTANSGPGVSCPHAMTGPPTYVAWSNEADAADGKTTTWANTADLDPGDASDWLIVNNFGFTAADFPLAQNLQQEILGMKVTALIGGTPGATEAKVTAAVVSTPTFINAVTGASTVFVPAPVFLDKTTPPATPMVWGSSSDLWPTATGSTGSFTIRDTSILSSTFGVAFMAANVGGARYQLRVVEVAVEITTMDPTTGAPVTSSVPASTTTPSSTTTVAGGTGAPRDSGIPLGAIIGAAVGGAVILACIVIIIVVLVRRRNSGYVPHRYDSHPSTDYHMMTPQHEDMTTTAELNDKFVL